MALLTDDIQDKLIKLLVDEGLIEQAVIDDAKQRATELKKPLLTFLTDENILDNELLVHAVAQVSGVPYVNLQNSTISQDILNLLSSDIAERFMAVPLAEVQNRLAVAMIDANNIQAIDYLSSRIQRPLKVFMASEASVRHALDQYKTDFSSIDVAAKVSQEEHSSASGNIQTIVQDSPISRALSTILEYAVKSRAFAFVTSTPQRSHTTPLYLILLYFPQWHSQSFIGPKMRSQKRPSLSGLSVL